MSDRVKIKIKSGNDWKIILCAIICIASLEVVALLNGINGTILRIVIAAIAGLAGLMVPKPKMGG